MLTPSKSSPCVGIRTCSDYSPFGVELDGRTVSGGYRFGFQNQEKDNEIKGEGNSINFEYRMHDLRIGRFFAIDPLSAKYPYYTPYAFSGNRLFDAKEIEGLEPGVLFDSPDEAAVNFGQYYNDNSIRETYEYGAPIYKVKTAEGIKYAYTKASIGCLTCDDPHSYVHIDFTVPEGTELVAWTHTHAEFVNEANNNFSGAGVPYRNTDIGIAIDMKIDAYVTTPNGTTNKYDYSEDKIEEIDFKSPSDPKDPTNNKVPSSYENFIKLGEIEFNSNKAKKSKKNEGVLIVTDIKTKKDFGVIRKDDGTYEFYRRR